MRHAISLVLGSTTINTWTKAKHGSQRLLLTVLPFTYHYYLVAVVVDWPAFSELQIPALVFGSVL